MSVAAIRGRSNWLEFSPRREDSWGPVIRLPVRSPFESGHVFEEHSQILLIQHASVIFVDLAHAYPGEPSDWRRTIEMVAHLRDISQSRVEPPLLTATWASIRRQLLLGKEVIRLDQEVRDDEVVDVSFEQSFDQDIGTDSPSEERWSELGIADLLELTRNYDTNSRSARIAVAIIENRTIPPDQEASARSVLREFIGRIVSSDVAADQIALRCAIRKFIFLGEEDSYDDVLWLLRILPRHSAINRMQVITTFTDFLRFKPPSSVVEADALVEQLQERCAKFLDQDFLSVSEFRVVAVDLLLALILLGRSEALDLIDRAKSISPGFSKSMARRLRELQRELDSTQAGSAEAQRILGVALGAFNAS